MRWATSPATSNGCQAVPDQIVIEGIPPYDGAYDWDLDRQELTTREWGWIKRLTGYLPLDLSEPAKWGDPEVLVCFAAMALRRAGRVEAREVPQVFERLADAPFDGAKIQLETEEAEADDAGPPPSSSNGSTGSSGAASPPSSEPSMASPPAFGMPASASTESGRTTLGT
jgi:hypothetical protein